jgi:Domain of unknown function (DUF4345)
VEQLHSVVDICDDGRIGHDAIIGCSAVNPTSDGEDRFLWCARDVAGKRLFVIFLAAVTFVGGIRRLLSVILVGPPHPFYLAMPAIELGLPPLMVLMAKRVTDPSQAR